MLTATTTFAQTQFWSDDFEDAGSPSAGSRVSSIPDFNCTNQHYFARNTPATFSLQNGSYSNYSGSKMYAFEDIDFGPTCTNASIGFAQTISWSGINIAGKTGLSFKGLFGADPISFQSAPVFPTNYDYMEVYYRIDGGAWTKIIGIYANSGDAVGGPMALDNNNDLIGDGTPLTYALSEISANIAGSGTTLDLRFNVSTNATVQELGIDNFRLYESAACNITSGISSQINVSCSGGSNGSATVSASGGAAPYTYSWAPSGGTAATATGLAAGSYTVTITDNIGCTKTQTVNITQPAAITSSIVSQTNIACNGGSTGAATITASGGTGTLTYNWTPGNPTGDGTASVSGLPAGTWTCTITDANSCTKTQSVTITQPSVITSSVSSQTNVSCNGGSNGSATITASGGTGPYIYSWAPSGGTAATATGLAAGPYTVTITDANACTKTQSVTITQPAVITSGVSSQTNVS
ncbi:MAG: SprB repeat-containing protein, partial [Sphingobacteriales bacterium]|nr:SprB repeat-containing protein [Sphingobacteriales bacterium]